MDRINPGNFHVHYRDYDTGITSAGEKLIYFHASQGPESVSFTGATTMFNPAGNGDFWEADTNL